MKAAGWLEMHLLGLYRDNVGRSLLMSQTQMAGGLIDGAIDGQLLAGNSRGWRDNQGTPHERAMRRKENR